MIVVGTASGIYTYERAGDGWALRSCSLEGVAVTGVAVMPDGRFVASSRQGLFESSDDGTTWRSTWEGVNALAVTATPDGAVYAGIMPAGLVRSRDGRAYERIASVDDLPSRATWTFPGAPHTPNIRSIAVSPSAKQHLYAGVEVGGVIATGDDGATWSELREGLHLDVHTLACVPGDDDVLYAATGRGFFRSRDAGRTWESRNEGMHSLYAVPLAVQPGDPNVLFTAATEGRPRYRRNREGGAMATVYRSVDAGEHWQAVLGAPPDTLEGAVDALAVAGDGDGTVFAGTEDGKLLAGASAGASWSLVADGLPAVRGLAVA